MSKKKISFDTDKVPIFSSIAIVLVVVFYLIIHLAKLTNLPVFADEAIYIRWTQLIMDDPGRYLFFPMNDGKPPLHMWLMLPFQYLFNDQLYAGRFLSVLVGLVQIFVLAALVRSLGGRKKATYLSMIFGSIVPFWYLHHRMALIDALMTLFLSLCLLFLIKLSQKITTIHAIFAGLFFGLALLSKLPAILFVFAFSILAILLKKRTELPRYLFFTAFSLLFGLVVFASLKIHPAFGQLFARGGDFLYPLNDFFTGKTILSSFGNLLRFSDYILSYQTWPLVVFSFIGLFQPKTQKQQFVLWLLTLSFLAPIVLLGKVVYPRYLLPVAIFITTSAVIALQGVSETVANLSSMPKKAALSLLTVFLISITTQQSVNFIYNSINDYEKIPFNIADKSQYLYEWSAGYGIKEVTSFIQEAASNQRVSMATEGYFGTLPDGILMYLHARDVSNIFVEGIGQPVMQIPDSFVKQAAGSDRVLLLVNSHRLKMSMDQSTLLREYCRPANPNSSDGPQCLQLWDITQKI
ncbi:MAG: ArnT family glycosyltransferase [Patescibacteria group bacterium]